MNFASDLIISESSFVRIQKKYYKKKGTESVDIY